jgi:dolichol-phosphate mannosyltransferase
MKNYKKNITQSLFQFIFELIQKYRFVKFALVGISGTIVNMVVLTVCHEYLFSAWEAQGSRPFLSLAVAILISALSNFLLNRRWTWSDRSRKIKNHNNSTSDKLRHFGKDFFKYATACGFGVFLQYVITITLSGMIEYRLANLIGITLASISNFLANDKWTFRSKK